MTLDSPSLLSQVTDLAIFSRQPRLFEAQSNAARKDQCFLLTTGASPTLGFYSLGGSGGYYRGLGELVTAVRRRIARAVVGTVGLLNPWTYLRGSSEKADPFAPPGKAKASPPVSLAR